jgi:hypothetical protein
VKTSKLLEKAQAVLMGRGLAKFRLRDAEGRVCAFGALREALCGDATGHRDGMTEKLCALGEVLAEANSLGNGEPSTAVVSFNNAPETTLGDVLQAFDAGIAYAKAQEGGR